MSKGGHCLEGGKYINNKTIRCDECKQTISVFTYFKSCRECGYNICLECYGYSVTTSSTPIQFISVNQLRRG